MDFSNSFGTQERRVHPFVCKVNEVTQKDVYSIPRIDDTLDTLAEAKWFSTLDLKSGYW